VNVSPHARICLLNGFSVETDRWRGSPDDHLPHSAQRLIAHLGLTRGPGRAAIAGKMWPDVPEVHAQGSLRSVLCLLQKVLPGLVEARSGVLRLAPRVSVDVHELDDWARRVLDPDGDIAAVDTPSAAWDAELLPGWYDDWVLLERERVRQLRMHALEQLAERLVAVGRFGEAVQAASAAVRAEPLRESAHRVLVHVHLMEGNTVEALREYDSFRTTLAAELGVAPTPLMDRLMQPILRVRRNRPPAVPR